MSRYTLTCLVVLVLTVTGSAEVRVPAEFEPVSAVVMHWSPGSDDALYATLVDQVSRAGAEAVVVVSDPRAERVVRDMLYASHLGDRPIRLVVSPANTSWVRDYGAVPYYQDGARRFAEFQYMANLRPVDNGSARRVWQQALPLSSGRSVTAINLALEGGDFITDGFGTLFTSQEVVAANLGGGLQATGVLQGRLGMRDVSYMPRLSWIPSNHIDMYMKLLDEETILVGYFADYPQQDPALEEAVRHLERMKSCYGTAYRIVRIPTRVTQGGRMGEPILLSYTNALTVNDRVLVPQYGIVYDAVALDIYAAHMPGYQIVGIDCTAPITEGGAIHCLTREIPVEKVVRVAHPRFRTAQPAGDRVTFEATVWAEEIVDAVTLYLCAPDSRFYEAHTLAGADGRYAVTLPLETPGTYRYYLDAVAGGQVGARPQNGGRGGYLTVDVAPSPLLAPDRQPSLALNAATP